MNSPWTPPGRHGVVRTHGRSEGRVTTTSRGLPALVAGVALALLAAGCGGGTKTVIQQAPQTQTVVQEAPATVTQTVATTSAAPTSHSSSSSSNAKVPDLVGERLDVAEDDLDGMNIRYREVGGGTFGIVVKSNWTVCETSPAAGERADGPVRLVVDREC